LSRFKAAAWSLVPLSPTKCPVRDSRAGSITIISPSRKFRFHAHTFDSEDPKKPAAEQAAEARLTAECVQLFLGLGSAGDGGAHRLVCRAPYQRAVLQGRIGWGLSCGLGEIGIRPGRLEYYGRVQRRQERQVKRRKIDKKLRC